MASVLACSNYFCFPERSSSTLQLFFWMRRHVPRSWGHLNRLVILIYKAGTYCPFVKWNALRKLDVSGLLCPRSMDWCVWGGHLGRMESTVQMSWRPVLSVAPPSVQPSSVQATQHVCLLPLSLRPTVGLLLQILGSCSTLGCTPMLTRPAVSVFPFHITSATQGLFKMESVLRWLYVLVKCAGFM